MRNHSIARVLTGALVALLVATGCSSDGESVTRSLESDTREGADDTSDTGTDPTSDFCTVATELADRSAELDDDPVAALGLVEELAAVAPPELEEDFDLFVATLTEVTQLDEDDPENFTRFLELLLDPEMQAAQESINDYSVETCGVDIDEATGSDSVDELPDADDPFPDLDDPDDGGEGDVGLEDVAAVKEANEGASWVEKATGTLIGNGVDVTVSADADGFSADEAMAACTALVEALVPAHPDVTIKVNNGETTLASSTGDRCSPA